MSAWNRTLLCPSAPAGPAHAAVVGEKDDDGLVGDPAFLQRGEHAAHAVVEALDHRGVDGVALGVLRVGERPVLGDELILRVVGGVDAELPVVRVRTADPCSRG